MMITGRIWKDGNDWLAESETIDVCTQGTSQADAAEMLADAIETLVDHKGFKVQVSAPGDDGGVAVEANEPATFAAFLLQRLREQSGKSLADVALAMGKASRNAFARYEQGEAVPTIEKFEELLQVVAPGFGICIVPRERAWGKVVDEKPISGARVAEGGISYSDVGAALRKRKSKGGTLIIRTKNAQGGRGPTVVVNPGPKKKKGSAKPTATRRARGALKPAHR